MTVADIQHEERAHRFVAQLDGLTAQLDYELVGQVMSITHTNVPARFRGRGIAAELMQATLRYATQKNLQVHPVCTYAVAFMQRNAAESKKHQEALLDEALEESFPASDSPTVGGVN